MYDKDLIQRVCNLYLYFSDKKEQGLTALLFKYIMGMGY